MWSFIKYDMSNLHNRYSNGWKKNFTVQENFWIIRRYTYHICNKRVWFQFSLNFYNTVTVPYNFKCYPTQLLVSNVLSLYSPTSSLLWKKNILWFVLASQMGVTFQNGPLRINRSKKDKIWGSIARYVMCTISTEVLNTCPSCLLLFKIYYKDVII